MSRVFIKVTSLSYTRFLEVLPSLIVPMCAYFTSLKGKPAGFEFIDSKR
jgi:hypothetical protein